MAAGYGFDVENDFEGISYNEDAVSVSYYADRGCFDGNKAGEYETYYKVVPISGKEPYLICRTISVREPETAKTADASSDSGETGDGEDEPEDAEVPDLAEGEMPELTTDNPVTFRLTSEAVMMAASLKTAAASSKDSMKVSNNGYAKYCGHSIGVKYISESGDYYHHLVYCLDMNKNTTSGTVSSSSSTSKIKPTITYCLVNGARKLNGTCNNSKYSSGSATQDYFITSAAIHVLNGEVGLSYYNNGSLVGETLCGMDREIVCVLNIGGDGRPINCNFASMGALNYSMAHPRELLKTSILSNAASMLLIHNHPSQSLCPSKEDVRVTDRMQKLCSMVGIPLMDHIIIGGNNREYFSFKEKGIMKNACITYATNPKYLDYQPVRDGTQQLL